MMSKKWLRMADMYKGFAPKDLEKEMSHEQEAALQ